MGHNTGTQRDSATVPKRQHLYRRNGTYYFRLRIPQDLLQAKAYGSKEEIKFSLGTKERHEAERLASTQLVKYEEEFADKRIELEERELRHSRRNGKVATVAKSEAKFRPLSGLSKVEQDDLIMRIFIRLEKGSAKTRAIPPIEKDRVEEALENVGVDRAVYSGATRHHAPVDWKRALTEELRKRRIDIDQDSQVVAEELTPESERVAKSDSAAS
ncbi:MAG: DUF6538 domain-containing protein [Verrucomicrobiota bacterium]